MQVIPVIDLKGGQVVRALRGARAAYPPIASPLCASSSPPCVASSLLEYTASRLLYLADLDALSGGPPQVQALVSLLATVPGVELWLDAGFADHRAWAALHSALGEYAAQVSPVFASEALHSAPAARAALADPRRSLLSLDRAAHGLPDRAGCWTASELWPERVILMNLDRVGSFEGPDLEALATAQCRRPDVSLIGAGGIRNADDLLAAEATGASGWLVASALHDRLIPPAGSL